MPVSEDMLEEIENIPMLSQSATRLLELVGDEDHSVKDIVSVVECDAFLAGAILKVANSASIGKSTRFDSVSRAISYLGDKAVVSIALGIYANKLYNKDLDGYEAEKGSLWAHCLRTAIAARELARLPGCGVSPEICYTAGLIHDIGKAVLSSHLRGTAHDFVRELWEHPEHDYLFAEREKVGTDHCEVGRGVAEHWKLPEQLIIGIQYHHTPADAPEEFRGLAFMVHMADIVAMMGGTSTGADGMKYNLDPNYVSYIRLTTTDLARLILKVEMDFDKTTETFKSGM